MDAAAVVGFVGALLGAGGLAALLQAKALNKKTTAEADVTLGSGWKLLWESVKADNNELRERVAVVEAAEEQCRERLNKIEGVDTPHMERAVAALIQKEIVKRGGVSDRRRQQP